MYLFDKAVHIMLSVLSIIHYPNLYPLFVIYSKAITYYTYINYSLKF